MASELSSSFMSVLSLSGRTRAAAEALAGLVAVWLGFPLGDPTNPAVLHQAARKIRSRDLGHAHVKTPAGCSSARHSRSSRSGTSRYQIHRPRLSPVVRP